MALTGDPCYAGWRKFFVVSIGDLLAATDRLGPPDTAVHASRMQVSELLHNLLEVCADLLRHPYGPVAVAHLMLANQLGRAMHRCTNARFDSQIQQAEQGVQHPVRLPNLLRDNLCTKRF